MLDSRKARTTIAEIWESVGEREAIRPCLLPDDHVPILGDAAYGRALAKLARSVA